MSGTSSSPTSPETSPTSFVTVANGNGGHENGGNGNGNNGKRSNGHHVNTQIKVPDLIVKRDGRQVSFDPARIETALLRCFNSLSKEPDTPLDELTQQAVNIVAAKYIVPSVEQVQDIVEMVLLAAGEYEAAKHYILYRAERAKLRAERPIPADVREAFAKSDAYFPSQLQKFQYYDKYARFNYDHMRRETWIETVERAVAFLRELSHDRLPEEDYARLHDAILNMKAMPSMRLLAMAGKAAQRSNVTIYNCSYMPADSLDAFVEALIISMSGCGVGYSVERKYVEQLPRVLRQSGEPPLHFQVPDSAEGWAEAVRLGLETWFDGRDIEFDYSLVRPAGAPLITKGGRASGPEPLRKMLNFVRDRVLARQGGFLRPLDAHDIMCAVGGAAVSGGVRRTAMIALFDFDDDEMRQCKNAKNIIGNEQRWNANNSIVWPDRDLSQAEITRYLLEMVESGSGEPGIFSRRAANNTIPERRKPGDFGTNPCVTADTWVMTQKGPRQVNELIDTSFFALVDGQSHASTETGFFPTGHKEIFLVETEEGHTLRATADHPILYVSKQTRKTQVTEWREVGDLQAGDMIRLHNQRGVVWEAEDEGAAVAWLLGLLVGDGTFVRHEAKNNQAILRFWGEHSQMLVEMAHGVLTAKVSTRSDLQPRYHQTNQYWQLASTGLGDLAARYGIQPGYKGITPEIERTSSAFYAGFLRGLFDADGAVIGEQEKGVSVRLAQSDLPLLQAVQRMLLRLGVNSVIYQNRRDAGLRLLPDGKGGLKEYWNKAQHELVIANDNIQEFQQRVGFSEPAKAAKLSERIAAYQRTPNRERFTARIKSITPLGYKDVYDCTIPQVHAFDANGLYVHNCGEIVLRPYQFCNLSITVARPDDTFEELKEKVELATIIGTIQSAATHFPGLRPQWRQNCEEERLLGVDINGQMDSELARDPEVQVRLREHAVATNQRYADMLGINRSAAVTTVKPSGNSSQLLNCSPGVHPRWAPYYVRNVRVGVHTPVYKVLRDAGAPMDPENGQTADSANTWVAHFPVKAPEGAITRNDRSALEQCEYWLQVKTHWTEHNPSVTITYQPDEVLDIIRWVWENQDKIGGMTFLPAFDAQYDQMPYEEIGEEEYIKRAATFPDIDFSKLWRYEQEDYTTAAQELACLGGHCDII